MGQASISPNRRYTLVWQDAGWNGDAADPRGRYVLIDGERVLADARMDRPQHGKVADDGTFVLNDWETRGHLCGTFRAFRPDGSEILSHAFDANLYNNGLAQDGSMAVAQTCNAPGPDSSVLVAFDLRSGTVSGRWVPECGWANDYRFPGDGRVRLLRRDRLDVHYTLQGEFLDRRAWLADEIRRGNATVIRRVLAEGEAASGLTLEELAAGARTATLDEDVRFHADVYRLLGEIEEARLRPGEALEAYRRALAINPRVGVAKRAATLARGLERDVRADQAGSVGSIRASSGGGRS